ncbi:MAG: LytTR family DNA-binding domain-containing protein [Bacteroidota bacterium]
MIALAQKNWKSLAGIILSVWLCVFLFLFSEDGLSLFKTIIISFQFGILSGVIYTLNLILFSFFTPPFTGIARNVFDITWNILFIGAANYGLVLFLNDASFSWPSFFALLSITALIGIVPSAAVYLLEHNARLSKELEQKKPIIDHLETELPKSGTRWTIRLNKSDSRNINLEALVYVESQKNYLTLYFDNGNSCQVRITLKKLEESFKDFDFLIRCHRSFLVNLQKVTGTSSTNNGLQLTMEGITHSIPVSRSYIKKVQDWVTP